MEPFLGEVRVIYTNFAPRGWAFCEGQILSLSQNTALFSLLGTTYGGNGQTTFALPDMKGCIPVHADNSSYHFMLGNLTKPSPSRTLYPLAGDSQTRQPPPQAKPNSAQRNSRVETSAPTPELLQVLIADLPETQKNAQRVGELQAEVKKRILSAAGHCRDFQTKSKEAQFSDAGSSLQALLQEIQGLRDDHELLPELEKFAYRLKESQELISAVVFFQESLAKQVKSAGILANNYRNELETGRHGEAGSSLEELITTVSSLGTSLEPEKEKPRAIAVTVQSRPPSTTPTAGRFLAAHFIIALEGVFPPR